MARIAREELSLPVDLLGAAVLMGTWDHFYPDSAFSPLVSTHYVNLPYWLQLDWQDIDRMNIQPDNQHSDWQWMNVRQAEVDLSVHSYVQVYAAWVKKKFEAGNR